MATRRSPGWLAPGLLAVAAAAGAGIWAWARAADRYADGVAVTAAIAVVLVAAGVLVRRVGTCGGGTVLLGVAFMLSQLDRPVAIGASALFGVLLFAMFELASAAASRSVIRFEPVARRHRRFELVTAVALGLTGACVVAVAGAAGRGGGFVLFVIGCAAAIGMAWVALGTTRASS
jgi:hypothetical protein